MSDFRTSAGPIGSGETRAATTFGCERNVETGTSPGGLTILRTIGAEHSASKQFTLQQDGTWKKDSDYNLGFKFQAERFIATNLDHLANKITELRSQGDVVIVRGDLDAAYDTAIATEPDYLIARRVNNKGDGIPAHIVEVPRWWVMLDIDGYPLKPGVDLLTQAEQVIDDCVHDILPPCFHRARCFWQLSSSAGIEPGVLKVHLFYWLGTPICNRDLRAWFKYFAPHVDIHPFNANQPHFICDPRLIGGDDPVQARTGWRDGTDEVQLPPLPLRDPGAPQRKASDHTGRATTPGLHCETVEEALDLMGDGDGLDGFHRPLLAASFRYAVRCRRGAPRDDAAFWDHLREAIDDAPKRAGRDVTEYLDESYLRRITEGGFTFITNTAQHETTSSADTPLPLGFGFDQNKLWFCDPADEKAKPIWVTHQFHVVGVCEDGTGDEWGIVMCWRDDAGHDKTWIVPRAAIHGDPKVIAGDLERQGLHCNYTAHAALRRFLANICPVTRMTAVVRAGWHGTSYVMADGTLFGGSQTMMRPEMCTRDLSCAQAGSLTDWHRDIARFAVGNSRVMFPICAALTGPLLEPVSEPSGGFHMVGGSRIGKTTGAVCGASTIGKGGRGGAKRQWRTTANGLEAVAAVCCDGPLVLDEISQADAKEAGDCVYLLANESGKNRMTKNITARATSSWCLIFISTGEVTLQQKMSDAGKRPMAGMSVRMIDIPADAGKGMGAFENLHGFSEPALFADHLSHMAQTTYGSAFRAFIERLVAFRQADDDGFCNLLRQRRQNFVDQHLPTGSNSQVRSVCARFGLVATAGELATEWGVLPWAEGQATQATATCFKAWLDARGSITSGEELFAFAQVQKFFEAHGMSRFAEMQKQPQKHASTYPWQRNLPHQLNTKAEDAEEHDQLLENRIINRCGFRRYDAEADRWDYFVLPQSWREEVCKGIDPEITAKMLADRGHLLPGEGKNLARKEFIPEHGRKRVYVVLGSVLDTD